MALTIGTTSVSNITVKQSSVSSAVNLVYVKQGNTTTTVFVKQPTINSAKCWTSSSGNVLYSATVSVTNPCDKELTCYILAYDDTNVVRDTVSFRIGAKQTVSRDIGLSSVDEEGSEVLWSTSSSVVAYLEDTNGCESLRTESEFTYEEKVYGKLLKPTNVSVSWVEGDRNDFIITLRCTNPNNVAVTANWSSVVLQKTGSFSVDANSSDYTTIVAETDQDRGNLDGDVYFSASGYADSDRTFFN